MSLGEASTISVSMELVFGESDFLAEAQAHSREIKFLFLFFAFFTNFLAQDDHREDGPGAQHAEEPTSPASGGKQVAVERGLVLTC